MKTFIFLTSLVSSIAYSDQATDLLKESDRARGSIESGVTWETTLKTIEDGELSERSFVIQTRGDNAHVKATAPARTKGEVFLFNSRNMWFYRPTLKKPVSISARQKLSGLAANGDIASTNYLRDYDAKIVGDDKVNGETAKVLILKSKTKDVTYDQIKYWISSKSKLALKAEFMTIQGKAFKIATFEYNNTIDSKGRKLPFISRMIIADAKFPENKSIIDYSNPKATEISTSLFNVNNLTR